jgi:hypothetical protein
MFFIKIFLDFDAQILTLNVNLSPKTIVVVFQIPTYIRKKPNKTFKVNVIQKFQDVWSVKMPQVEPMFDGDGNFSAIKCKVCTKIESK